MLSDAEMYLELSTPSDSADEEPGSPALALPPPPPMGGDVPEAPIPHGALNTDHNYFARGAGDEEHEEPHLLRSGRPRVQSGAGNMTLSPPPTIAEILATILVAAASRNTNPSRDAFRFTAAAREAVRHAARDVAEAREEVEASFAEEARETTSDEDEPAAAVVDAPSTSAAASTVDLTEVPDEESPPKKRKRTGAEGTTIIRKASPDGTIISREDDDGVICPICLDMWDMDGPHRLVSLRCGHLFGEDCIRKWLTECQKNSSIKCCPQCKTKAGNRDIRQIYALRVRAIDRSEEHRLRKVLEDKKLQAINLQKEIDSLQLSYSTATIRIRTLEADNCRMRSLSSRLVSNAPLDADMRTRILQQLDSYKLFMESNVEISRESGCRVMTYADHSPMLILSQKSIHRMFSGYGLRFMDVGTFKLLNFLHTSAKLIRDISLNADQQMLAVASMEPRAKTFDLRTRQVCGMFTPSEKVLWASAMDRKERENILYLGAQHGSTYLYDIRFPETIVEEFRSEGDASPVINIAPVPSSKKFENGGFLVCKLQTIWFHEYQSANTSVKSTRLNVEGPFLAMKYDDAHETLLISARQSSFNLQSRFMFGTLQKFGATVVFDIKVSFFGAKISPIMTRATQIAVEANTLIAGYIQDVKMLTLFDVRRTLRSQSLPIHDVVYDTCPIYTSNETFLAALTETKCRIYKLRQNKTN